MEYYVLYGQKKYGPYETWEDAYFFARTAFGFAGWIIWERD